ncbi:MAG: hypothetical protein K2N34_07445 [Lachnospiraceae bacterium]|nr:hypothetical protein [Lachnospiraceae bacterium]
MIGNGGGNFGFDMGALLGNMMGARNGNGFGGDSSIWAIILIIALCGGFGNGDGNGLFGNRGGGTSAGTAAVEASLQRGFDNQSVINKLNGLENGVCNLGYAQLGQTNDITNTVTTTGNDIIQSLQTLMVTLMQQGFAQSTQAKDCCCKIENLLQEANYNRRSDTCDITNAIKDMAQAIMQNDNANYRQLHDENIAIQMQAKDDRIADLTARLTRCDNRSDNAEQTAQILGQLMALLNPPTVRAIPVNSGFGWYGSWGNNCNNGNTCCNGNNGNFFGFA